MKPPTCRPPRALFQRQGSPLSSSNLLWLQSHVLNEKNAIFTQGSLTLVLQHNNCRQTAISEEEYDILRWQIDFHLEWSTCFYITHFRRKWVSELMGTHNLFFWQCEFASVHFAGKTNAAQYMVNTDSKSDFPLKRSVQCTCLAVNANLWLLQLRSSSIAGKSQAQSLLISIRSPA